MPTYAYACTACGHRFEVQQSFTDAALSECPECAGRLRKLFNNVGIVFKGSGFYRTDSRSGSPKGSGSGASDAASSSSGTEKAGSSSESSSSTSSAASTTSSGSSESSTGTSSSAAKPASKAPAA